MRRGRGPSRLKPFELSVHFPGGHRAKLQLTIRHIDDEFASLSLVPASDNVIDRVIPRISQCGSSDLTNLHPADDRVSSGISELDHDKIGSRSHALCNSTSYSQDGAAMAVPIGHVLGSELIVFANERRDSQGKGVGYDVFIDRAAVESKFLRGVLVGLHHPVEYGRELTSWVLRYPVSIT